MSGPLFLANLGIYCLQIGIVVAVAGLVPALVRMRAPGARLAYWHFLLAACIALPIVRPWRQEVITAAPVLTFSTAPASTYTPAATLDRGFPWREAALVLLVTGAAVRLGWLVVGLWKLRRYRLHSQPLDTAYDADIRVSADVSSPVTFGALRPVILVPPHFAELPSPMQRAILCHEILHIERHDWLFTMAEELVRVLFWFHPAIWWVLGQIHLTREQAVDQRVVDLTEERDPYIDALLAMAGVRPQLDLAPAPLFLRKRHLKHRVVEILKENKMSKKRLISALAAGTALLALACWFVTGAVPLAAAPQMVADAPGISVDLNGAQLMHRTSVLYPADAAAKGIGGTVVVQVKLDANGEVTDAAVQSGPEELHKAAIQSVLNWHFSKDEAGTSRSVTITFTAPPARQAATSARAEMVQRMPVPAAGNNNARTLTNIEITGLSDQAKSDLLAQLPVHVGDSVGADQFGSIMEAVHKFDAHLTVILPSNPYVNSNEAVLRISAPGTQVVTGGIGGGVGFGVGGGVTGGIGGGIAKSTDAAPASNPQRIRIGSDIQANKLVVQNPPAYPALAKQARIQGTVELSAVIGKDGHVVNLSVNKGHPLLVQSALEAVKDWVYQPTLLNGQPVEVATTIDVNFTLAQ